MWQAALSTVRDDDPDDHDDGSDAALVEAARTDAATFERLYLGYRDRIYWYLRGRTADDEDAADLTQQVFLRVLDALPQYQPRRGPFAAWLFGIARNMATDAHRRRRTTVAWEAVPAALQPVDETDLEAATLRRDDLDRLDALVRALEPEKREVLALRFAARLTVPEIAAVIGKREDATRKYLARTLHTLKERYDDQ